MSAILDIVTECFQQIWTDTHPPTHTHTDNGSVHSDRRNVNMGAKVDDLDIGTK